MVCAVKTRRFNSPVQGVYTMVVMEHESGVGMYVAGFRIRKVGTTEGRRSPLCMCCLRRTVSSEQKDGNRWSFEADRSPVVINYPRPCCFSVVVGHTSVRAQLLTVAYQRVVRYPRIGGSVCVPRAMHSTVVDLL